MKSRLLLANTMRTRPGDLAKDARNLNAYPEVKGNISTLRKRPGILDLGYNAGANPQMAGNAVEAHSNITLVGGNSLTINETSGTTTAASWTSATKTTDANCVNVTPHVSFLSSRGTGLGQWYYRSIRWRVDYWNGSSWVAGTFRIVDIGAQTTTPVLDSALFTFPSLGTWQWRIYAEAYDTNGTLFGSIVYSYSTETLNGGTVNDSVNDKGSIIGATSKTVTYNLPSSVVNPTWEIYQIRYQLSYTAGFFITSFYGGGNPSGTFSNALRKNGVASPTYVVNGTTYVAYQQTYSYPGSLDSGLLSGSNLTYIPGYFSCVMSAEEFTMVDAFNPQVSINMTGGSVTIYRRSLTSANSTTINNLYKVDSYEWVIQVGSSGGVPLEDPTKGLIVVSGDVLDVIDLIAL